MYMYMYMYIYIYIYIYIISDSITDYQMISSNKLVVKSLIPTSDTVSSLCLIIKGLDNQVQETNYQINQYLSKRLIVCLWTHVG